MLTTKKIFSALLLLICTGIVHAQKGGKIVGVMRDAMWKGELAGKIRLDTLDKKHLYGLGPLAYLKGELLMLNGTIYQSTVGKNGEPILQENPDAEAPFFGYDRIPQWKESKLPARVRNLADLEKYLLRKTLPAERPFFFRLQGAIDRAVIHIVNLPEGSVVRSPQEAHQGQQNYDLEGRAVEILGFFSTEHKTIFTHHDTFLHMHLMTQDKTHMGHLDDVTFKKGKMKLYLPKD